MKYLFTYILLGMTSSAPIFVLFDFSSSTESRSWKIVDDTVMGGQSASTFHVNPSEKAVFQGNVSTENNGGFSSVRKQFKPLDVKTYTKFILRVKGDGKKYQFRIKSTTDLYYSYVAEFKTTTKWQTIEIPFEEMYPSFRGRRLDKENFQGQTLSEVCFLIGNKKSEKFILELDKIELI